MDVRVKEALTYLRKEKRGVDALLKQKENLKESGDRKETSNNISRMEMSLTEKKYLKDFSNLLENIIAITKKMDGICIYCQDKPCSPKLLKDVKLPICNLCKDRILTKIRQVRRITGTKKEIGIRNFLKKKKINKVKI